MPMTFDPKVDALEPWIPECSAEIVDPGTSMWSEEEIMSAQTQRRLERPDDRVIAGVCHGLGNYFDIDPVVVRIVFVILTVAGGAGVLAYLILWIVRTP
jgi:phage shock protein PspC (stress-responsive transcriptional regulator)